MRHMCFIYNLVYLCIIPSKVDNYITTFLLNMALKGFFFCSLLLAQQSLLKKNWCNSILITIIICLINLSQPLKLDPEESFSLKNGHVESTPLLLHINGMVAWRDFDLTSMHCTLYMEVESI